MTDSLLNRLQCLVSAGVETVVGAAEKAGSDGLMVGAVRDAARTGQQVRHAIGSAERRAAAADARRDALAADAAALGEQARFAVGAGRDDLAEALVARQFAVEAEAAAAAAEAAAARDEQAALADALARAEARHAELAGELKAVRAARGGADAPRPRPRRPVEIEAALARAEAAFGRARAAAGDDLPLDAVRASAEVEALRRQRRVAERLAALKDEARPRKRAKG
jgi:phage shock protein A